MKSSLLTWVAFTALLGASCNSCNAHPNGADDLGNLRDGSASDGSASDGSATACTVDSNCAAPANHCCSGACVEAPDCSTAVTSVSPTRGFQNGGDFVTLKGAGFAAGMKAYIGDGRAPVRVIDPNTALIETPPGPVGPQDVKIVVGAATAILPGGFTYGSAGLEMKWEQKPLTKVRGEDPAIAVMQDGRVLVAGGTTVPDHPEDSLNTAEIYDRTSDTVTLVTSTMSTPRWQDSAITLLSGKVLVIGGACDADPCTTSDPQSADLFDPATNTFTPTSMKLLKPRYYTRAVLMVDGRVFISSENDPNIEIYDPATDSFTLLPHTQAHVYGFVVRLRDGRVLIGGGDGGVTAAELYDPDTNTISPTAVPMVQGRSMLTAHTLPDGRVMIIGGASMSAGGIIDPLASIGLFDPKNDTFAAAPYSLATPRCWQASALVRDGTVLVMGGYTVHAACDSSVASVEQIDPVAGTVKMFPSLLNTNTEWTAVTLHDGSVLGVGGGACGTSMALPDIDFLAGAPVQ